MASEQDQMCITLPASHSMTAMQYKCVKIAAPGVVSLSTGTADITIGILQNKPLGSCEAKVCIAGHTKVRADATVTTGEYLIASPLGGGGVEGATATPSERVIGVALTTAAGTGEYLEMLVERWVYPLL